MLISSREIVGVAHKGGYAVGGFNFSNLETLKAIIQAAEAQKAPILLQAAEGSISYGGLPYLAAMAHEAGKLSSVPVAIHLDHGKTLEMVKKCTDLGFNSVMIDGSALALEENIKLTKQVVDFARSLNVTVEGEIGQLNADHTKMADPLEAKEFVAKTGVDFLAAAVGTAHGVVENEKIDLNLLAKIREQIDIPLVLHGGSGVSASDIQSAIKLGVAKINIHTEIRLSFIEGMHDGITQFPNTDDHRDILKIAISKMQKTVEEKIVLFGSANKA